MGALKNITTDDNTADLLKLMREISNARDEYREEMFSLQEKNREIKVAVLATLRDAEQHCGVIALPKLRMLIAALEAC